jgi:Ni,Fe-hydrogenase III small subunit
MLHILRQIARNGIKTEAAPAPAAEMVVVARLRQEILRTLGRALTIRHVDAGSCNGCELEIHALSNPYYNLEGLGIKFVASPRHADMLLVTGPVSNPMAIALKRTLGVVPDPKLVVAAGIAAAWAAFSAKVTRHRAGRNHSADVEDPGAARRLRCCKASSPRSASPRQGRSRTLARRRLPSGRALRPSNRRERTLEIHFIAAN